MNRIFVETLRHGMGRSTQLQVKLRIRCMILIILGLSFTSTAYLAAQTTVAPVTLVNNATTTPVEGVGHDYLHDLNETVNPQNGQVSIRIAGPSPKERGTNYHHYAYMYDTSGRYGLGGQVSFSQCGSHGVSQNTCYPRVDAPMFANLGSITPIAGTVQNTDSVLSGLSTNLSVNMGQDNGGVETCQYSGPFVYEDQDGGLHTLNVAYIDSGVNCTNPFQVNNNQVIGNDAHFIAFLDRDALYIADLHGDIVAGGLQADEDSNGNLSNATGRPFSITTTTNNSPPTPGNGGPISVPSTVTLPGILNPSTGADTPYTYTYSTYSRSGSPGLSVGLMSGSTSNCYIDETLGQSTSFSDVSALTLPNGQSYSFGYESQWGMVNSITYPTGATVSYTWNVNTASEPFMVQYPAYDSVILASGATAPLCYYQQDLPVVAKRTVSYNGSTAIEQKFAYKTIWGGSFGSWTSKSTTVTTTDMIRPGHPQTVTIYNYTPAGASNLPWSTGWGYGAQESSIVYQDGSGNTLRTVLKVWTGTDLLGAECDIEGSGSSAVMSGKFYQYRGVPGYGTVDLPTDVKEFDYNTSGLTPSGGCVLPSGVPSRETVTQYASLPSSPLWPSSALVTSGEIPTAIPQINDRPSKVQIYGNVNGSSTLMSETDITYDQGSVASVSSAYRHDETNYGPSQSTERGNPTTITRQCFQSCTNSTITATYDETGQILSVTDANNHQTALSYSDSYSTGGTPPGNTNAYVTTIARPTTNGIQHVSSYQYNYAFGELTSAKDENQQQSTFVYSDVWGRLTQANTPDGGLTTIAYDDAGPNPTVTKSVLLNSTTGSTMTTETIEDEFGHKIHSLLTSDPAGPVTVDTVYDGMGRDYTVSNPYRTTSDPTYGITRKVYDALGRLTQQTNPDPSGTYITNAYTANAVLFTDENQNQWKRTSDSFGRLTQVLEPNGTTTAPSMETDYAYDALSNLLSVNQKGVVGTDTPRTRSFSYDSLSRLLSASNPETGTITYTYDPNGNVLTKTDARSVITYLSYDALNRLLTKGYSSVTSGSCFQYDSPITTAADSYPIGHLTLEWTQAGTCPSPTAFQTTVPSAALTSTAILSHDKMGRVWKEEQCVTTACTTSTPPTLSYAYDQVGNPITFTNSVGAAGGPLTLTAGFDKANHLNSVVSNWSAFPTGLYTISTGGYGPVGPLNWTLGPNLSVAQTFTKRLWVNSFIATGQVP